MARYYLIFSAILVSLICEMDGGTHFTGGTAHSLESESGFEAIRELIQKAPVFTGITDVAELEEAVISREHLQSTACGHGIAFAHGKAEHIKEIAVVLGISKKGISFNTPDGGPVHLLFIIASPPNEHLGYLMVLSSLARICYDECFVKEAVEILSEEEVAKRVAQLLNDMLNKSKLTMYR